MLQFVQLVEISSRVAARAHPATVLHVFYSPTSASSVSGVLHGKPDVPGLCYKTCACEDEEKYYSAHHPQLFTA